MNVTGLDAFAKIRSRMDLMTRVGTKVAARGAGELSARAQAAFDAGVSVYGVPYGAGIDLKESGALRSQALKYEPHGTKIRASVGGVRYAKYQLKHGFLPVSGRLPAAWKTALEAIANEELAKAAGGG